MSLESVTPEKALSEWRSAGESASSGQTFHCETVTPLFGGGVRAGEVDSKMPVRATSIRGQLRFWWRLCRGVGGDSRAQFAQERALWGGIGKDGPIGSKVRVGVRQVRNFNFADQINFHPYAIFSADGASSFTKQGVTFELNVEAPEEQWPEVEQALRWWASFGGLGARSRRGLGAVKVRGLAPVTEEEVREAGGRLALRNEVSDAMGAWSQAVERLKGFRQGVGTGRNEGRETNRPGRSRWPEPDAIRRTSGKMKAHPPIHPVQNLYPRAAFGLPIVFHFQGKDEPVDYILEPVDVSGNPKDIKRDRMASPLILRPYWDGKQWRPAALLIPGWGEALKQPLKFRGSQHTLTTWPSDPQRRADMAKQISPMKDCGNDPLSAFMVYFTKTGGV